MISIRRPALLAALAAGALHGILALTLFPRDRQLYKYPLAAAQYLAHTLPPERIVDFSPFYLYLHVAVGALTRGGQGGPPIMGVLILQLLAVSAATALLLLLLQRFLPTWIALAGTVAFIFSRSVMVYASVLEPEAFLLLFIVAFLYFSLRPEPGPRLLAGLAFALSVAIRPSVLPLLAVVPLFFLLNGGRRRWAAPTALVLAPALLVLLALGVRNGLATGSYSPLGMNPGFVFFEGNNPLSTGRSAVYSPLVGELNTETGDQPDSPHLAYRLIAERSSGRGLSTAQANRYWRSKALNFIADHPGRFLSALATKSYFTLHQYRRHDLVPAERFDRRLRERWIPAVPFALVSALALLGALVSLGQWRRLLLLYALLVSQTALMLLLYVSERQRLALVPCFVFFACAGVAHVVAARGARRAVPAVVCAALAAILALPNHLIREDRHLWQAYEARERVWPLAFRLRDQGDLAQASRAAALSYAVAPWLRDYSRPRGLSFAPDGFDARALAALGPDDGHPSRQLDRAQLLTQAGRLDEAEALLESLVSRGERFDRALLQSSQPHYYLARIASARGSPQEAVGLLGRALASAPGDPFVLAELAALTGDDGYRVTLARYFSEGDAALLVGMAQLRNGVGDNGLANLAEAIRLFPELWRARVYLAAALGANEDLYAATLAHGEAMAIRDDPVLLEERILPIFTSVAGNAAEDDDVHVQHGLVLAHFGRFDEALEVLRAAQAREARPELERAISEIERMRALSSVH